MRALICEKHGPASSLVLKETDDPLAGKNEVIVDIKAAGLNFPDTLIIEGKYQFKPPMPFSPGGEGAGVISAVGEGVEGLSVGDRVIATGAFGMFAEKVKVSKHSVIPIPAGMDFVTAAGFMVTYCTSYHALVQRAAIQKGESLLVLGAAGGVGLAAVELGKALGATVTAAASTEEKLDVASAHGASERINYTNENLKEAAKRLTGGRGFDVIYDPVGGEYSEMAVRSLAPNGRLLVVGFAAGTIPSIPLNLTLLKQCQIVGVFWGGWAAMNPEKQRDNLKKLEALFSSGQLKPLVSEQYEINRYEEAFDCLTNRKAKGKVIFVFDEK